MAWLRSVQRGRLGHLALVAVLGAGCASERQFAQVKVDSNPPSAEVWLGAEQLDTTPCTLLFERAGDFELYLKKSGYLSLKKRVTVVEQPTDKGSRLEALPPEMVVTLDPVAEEGGGGTQGGPAETPYYGR